MQPDKYNKLIFYSVAANKTIFHKFYSVPKTKERIVLQICLCNQKHQNEYIFWKTDYCFSWKVFLEKIVFNFIFTYHKTTKKLRL